MESEGWSSGPSGPSAPPPYTISDGGRHPAASSPSCPPSKSPMPNHRPIEAFAENPGAPYGSYPPGQMPYNQLPHGQFSYNQMPGVHMSGPYGGYNQPPGQFCAPGQPSYYPPYGHPHQRPPQQQQQQSVVIIGGATPQYNQPVVVVQSFAGQICLACFVFWCCGGIFGAVAFVLAVIASNQARQDPMSARQLGRASIWVSVAGIIVTIVIICIVVGILVSQIRYSSYYYY